MAALADSFHREGLSCFHGAGARLMVRAPVFATGGSFLA